MAVGFIFLGKGDFSFFRHYYGGFYGGGRGHPFLSGHGGFDRPGQNPPGSASELGAVPIGTPLIVGPAVLTISLMPVSVHGLLITLIALFLNIAIVGIVFIYSDA